MSKCIAKLKSKKGSIFVLVQDSAVEFSVLVLCDNYDGKVRGGIRKTWRFLGTKMNKAEAREMFYKKLGMKNPYELQDGESFCSESEARQALCPVCA